MEALLDEPRTYRHTANKPHYVDIDGVSERVYTVDEVFSRMEKNLNIYYDAYCPPL